MSWTCVIVLLIIAVILIANKSHKDDNGRGGW